jgi:hypothetical protein
MQVDSHATSPRIFDVQYPRARPSLAVRKLDVRKFGWFDEPHSTASPSSSRPTRPSAHIEGSVSGPFSADRRDQRHLHAGPRLPPAAPWPRHCLTPWNARGPSLARSPRIRRQPPTLGRASTRTSSIASCHRPRRRQPGRISLSSGRQPRDSVSDSSHGDGRRCCSTQIRGECLRERRATCLCARRVRSAA